MSIVLIQSSSFQVQYGHPFSLTFFHAHLECHPSRLGSFSLCLQEQQASTDELCLRELPSSAHAIQKSKREDLLQKVIAIILQVTQAIVMIARVAQAIAMFR